MRSKFVFLCCFVLVCSEPPVPKNGDDALGTLSSPLSAVGEPSLVLQSEALTTASALGCLPMQTPPRGAFRAWTCEGSEREAWRPLT
jgi:hypothetical protein